MEETKVKVAPATATADAGPKPGARYARPLVLVLLVGFIVTSLLVGGANTYLVFQIARCNTAYISGETAYSRGRYAEAARELEFVVRYRPQFWAARYYLGHAYVKLGREGAEEQWAYVAANAGDQSPFRKKAVASLRAYYPSGH